MQPLLLSRDTTTVNISAVNAMGNNVRVDINVTPRSHNLSFTEDLVDMRKENIFKAAQTITEKEMFPNSDPW
jgi:hypothetical protein